MDFLQIGLSGIRSVNTGMKKEKMRRVVRHIFSSASRWTRTIDPLINSQML